MDKSQKKYTGRLTPEQRAEIMGEAFDEAKERQEKREAQEKTQKKYTGRLTPEKKSKLMVEAFDKAKEEQKKREVEKSINKHNKKSEK